MSSDREKELEKELMWIHTLMQNDAIPPREKVVLYRTRYELNHSEKDESGMARIFVWKIAEATGVSTDSVGKSLKVLAEANVIRRKVGFVDSGKGQYEKAIYVGLTDVARNPSQIVLPANGHGGKRTPKLCPACGHNEHIEHKKHICVSCGTVFDETWKTVSEDENAELE